MARALLEGMARTFHADCQRVCELSNRGFRQLIGGGNGLRENPLLTQIVGETFGVPVQFPRHREEAAFGAALVAGVGAGCYRDLNEAGKNIRMLHPRGRNAHNADS